MPDDKPPEPAPVKCRGCEGNGKCSRCYGTGETGILNPVNARGALGVVFVGNVEAADTSSQSSSSDKSRAIYFSP